MRRVHGKNSKDTLATHLIVTNHTAKEGVTQIGRLSRTFQLPRMRNGHHQIEDPDRHELVESILCLLAEWYMR